MAFLYSFLAFLIYLEVMMLVNYVLATFKLILKNFKLALRALEFYFLLMKQVSITVILAVEFLLTKVILLIIH